ncbi:glycerophosphoryl diester phosphodiesterase [Lachnospiraceae bacterium NK3A20]|nr:glycerophosphoryl diester phosphodiesterase [Lachnospiraceae bacterium NK3A20]
MSTLVWAHRGASAYAPENTLEAFRKAADMKADGVELDVQLTKDNEIVVVHDENLERVSNGTGWVKDHTLAQLKALNFNRTHPEFEKASIPTLEEVYECLQTTGLTINVEFKTGIFWYQGIEDKVLDLTAKLGLEDRVIYSSFNHFTLAKLRGMKEDVTTGLLYSDDWIGIAPYARDTVHVNALHPALYHLQDPSYVKTAHEYGLETHVWTVNDEKYIRMCRDMGVEAIITNKPDLCRRVLAE